MMTGSCTPSTSPESLRTSGSVGAAAETASSAMVRINMIDHDGAGVNGILKTLASGRARGQRDNGPVAYSNRGPPMTLAEVRSGYRDQIVAAADRRGAHNIRVFGSVARGDQQHDSDIDFLVDFEPGRSLLDLTGLLLDLETVLPCKVDVVSARGLKPRLASEVMRDAVLL